MNCRGCGAPLHHVFVDLGTAPPSNAYLTAERLRAGEIHLPLRVLVCDHCWLVQTEDHAGAGELFDDEYGYFSSVSSSWLAHCRRYTDAMIERFGLGARSFVVEVAANDGYLLQYVAERSIPCLGIEPTAGTAAAARARGIDIVAYSRDAIRFIGVQVKALSKGAPVPLGTSLDKVMGGFETERISAERDKFVPTTAGFC